MTGGCVEGVATLIGVAILAKGVIRPLQHPSHTMLRGRSTADPLLAGAGLVRSQRPVVEVGRVIASYGVVSEEEMDENRARKRWKNVVVVKINIITEILFKIV